MTTQQHPAQFDWATELLDTQGRVTLSAQEANEIGARLRSMGEKLKAYEDLDEAASDVQLLRMGYTAARLEIESLRARGVAPAGAQQPGAVYAALSDAEIDRIVPALEPVSEDFPAEWAVWKDRERIRKELRASHGQAPAQAAPAAVAGPSEFPHEQMDAVALARYKVVPSHESMFHRHAVVAGDGSQQLYIGREVECENMAHKFAGAFLDGAFAFHSTLAAAPPSPPPRHAKPEGLSNLRGENNGQVV